MAFAAKLYIDARSAERYAVEIDATVRGPARVPLDVVVKDLSRTGFRIAATLTLAIDAPITLGISGIGMREARVVREEDGWYGCLLLAPLTEQELATAISSVANDPIALDSPYHARRQEAAPQPVEDKYPPAMRVGLLIGMPLAMWAALWFIIRAAA